MGLFSKLLKGPQPDMEKSASNEKKVRALFDQVVENGEKYRLIVGYTEDVKRFNGIPFVPQKLRNFPAILEHRKIQTNPL